MCATCALTVERWEGDEDPLAFGLYGGALAQALLRLKYGARPDLGPAVGRLLRDQVLKPLGSISIDIVVPVPVPRLRLVERGYNQAALIAAPLVRFVGARFTPMALWRADGTKQAALGRRERLVNLQGAVRVRHREQVADARVLLVDDVSTTGATIATCTRALLEAGARSVRSIVVARAEGAEQSGQIR
jgi:ComF family protein